MTIDEIESLISKHGSITAQPLKDLVVTVVFEAIEAEREACAKIIERARLRLGGEQGLTSHTDHVATRVVDFLAAQVRERGYDHLSKRTTFRAAAQMQRRIDELKAAAAAAVRERGEQE